MKSNGTHEFLKPYIHCVTIVNKCNFLGNMNILHSSPISSYMLSWESMWVLLQYLILRSCVEQLMLRLHNAYPVLPKLARLAPSIGFSSCLSVDILDLCWHPVSVFGTDYWSSACKKSHLRVRPVSGFWRKKQEVKLQVDVYCDGNVCVVCSYHWWYFVVVFV